MQFARQVRAITGQLQCARVFDTVCCRALSPLLPLPSRSAVRAVVALLLLIAQKACAGWALPYNTRVAR